MTRWLETIQRKHALLLAVAFAGAIPYGWHAAWSLGAGGGIQMVNLGALQQSVRLMLGLAERGAGALGQLLVTLRLLLFFGAVLSALMWAGVQPLAFGAGLLLALPAVIWQGVEEVRAGS